MSPQKLDSKLKLVNQGINDDGNHWFQYVLPNRRYAYVYMNKDGELYNNLYFRGFSLL